MNYISTFSGVNWFEKVTTPYKQYILFSLYYIYQIIFRWPQLQNKKEWNFQCGCQKSLNIFIMKQKWRHWQCHYQFCGAYRGLFLWDSGQVIQMSGQSTLYEVAVFMYTKWWCLSSWWGHHIEIRLKLQAPNYSARNLWRCQIVFLFPPKISQGNYDHVKLFSSFPYFQQLWRDHWCRFSQVLFVRGWTLCYTGKEEPALCVLAYRVKLKHYSYTVVLSSIYTTLPSLKAIWWQKHRAANHFNSPLVPPESGTFHPNLIWHMIPGRSSRSGSCTNRRLLRI